MATRRDLSKKVLRSDFNVLLVKAISQESTKIIGSRIKPAQGLSLIK